MNHYMPKKLDDLGEVDKFIEAYKEEMDKFTEV